jgi:hypothetical protein
MSASKRAPRPATFEAYREAVDMAVLVKCGLSLDDLPDVALVDWFDDGVSVTSAASRAIRNAKD